jgi:hypothetical protein
MACLMGGGPSQIGWGFRYTFGPERRVHNYQAVYFGTNAGEIGITQPWLQVAHPDIKYYQGQ